MQGQFSIPPTGIEVWRPVLGYEGFYNVSDLGRVRRIAPPPRGGSRPRSPDGILSPMPDRRGYLRVNLKRNGKAQHKFVHVLVIEAFLGPFSPGEETDHKNGIKADNWLANLEKVTPFENTRRAIRLGLRDAVGESNPSAKLSEQDIRAIRRMAATETGRELARRYRVSPSLISRIVSRRRWRHV